MNTTDSSTLMNLQDLFSMEADRRVEEAAAAERTKAEAAAKAEAARRDREDELTKARAEERRLAELARAQHDAAIDERIHRLRAELEAVRTEREAMLLEVAARVERPAPSRKQSWLAGTMAAASLVAALTATFVAWPRASEPMPAPTPIAIVHEGPVASETTVEATASDLEVETAPPAAPVVASETATPRRPHIRRPPTPQGDLASQLDLGDGDDVLSGDFLRAAEHR